MKKALIMLVGLMPMAAFANEAAGGASGNIYGSIGAAIAIGMAVVGGALGQGKTVAAAMEGISRNPAAQGKMFVPMMIGLAFMESLVLFAFAIAMLIK